MEYTAKTIKLPEEKQNTFLTVGRAQERFLRDKKKKRQAMYLKIEELKFSKLKTFERHHQENEKASYCLRGITSIYVI